MDLTYTAYCEYKQNIYKISKDLERLNQRLELKVIDKESKLDIIKQRLDIIIDTLHQINQKYSFKFK